MSPLLVNQKVLNENYKETCQNMYDSLTRQNYKSYIFIPYNFGYHWILLILSVETGNLIVFDSMRNPKSAIQHILDPLNRVWKKFMKNNKGRGQWRPELNVNMDYPCARQQQGTGWCGYYVCDYLHIMTPCGKATDEDTRVRPNRSLVYFHNCTNAHDVNSFFF
ncbi:hypothetical protein PVAP13_7KG021263 [Panicum virgatum]|uniref:Ubiquitin-like protease family profile domain-containing protein n=1 Tax=Panicum virgatum TaxID=38727 RepID=A0A8T0QAN6_PANVG|nr:hypothetical protein PVAP13_7KG021263 [Panicum virgatum]